MGTQVTATRTPLTATQVAEAITSAWASIVGGVPTQAAIAILTTQIDVETGWQNCWNWNVGNLAGTQGEYYVMLHASDGHFRPYWAFNSLTDGVTAYLKLLHSRYAAALQSASTGDIAAYAANLKAAGYYEEPESQYANALEARYSAVAKALGSAVVMLPSFSAAPSTTWIVIGGLALGALGFLVYEEVVKTRREVGSLHRVLKRYQAR